MGGSGGLHLTVAQIFAENVLNILFVKCKPAVQAVETIFVVAFFQNIVGAI